MTTDGHNTTMLDRTQNAETVPSRRQCQLSRGAGTVLNAEAGRARAAGVIV